MTNPDSAAKIVLTFGILDKTIFPTENGARKKLIEVGPFRAHSLIQSIPKQEHLSSAPHFQNHNELLTMTRSFRHLEEAELWLTEMRAYVFPFAGRFGLQDFLAKYCHLPYWMSDGPRPFYRLEQHSGRMQAHILLARGFILDEVSPVSRDQTCFRLDTEENGSLFVESSAHHIRERCDVWNPCSGGISRFWTRDVQKALKALESPPPPLNGGLPPTLFPPPIDPSAPSSEP